jgi:hypothetical protein
MTLHLMKRPAISGSEYNDSLQSIFEQKVEELMGSFPNPSEVSLAGGREIISRYGVVLEGNFIYWMTGCYIAAKSETARAIIRENLLEEVRDCHPEMLRRFVAGADSIPDKSHIATVAPSLADVRMFVSRLSPTALIAMMAFFELFIQRFMPMLSELAARQGSEEQEYTRVHGTCDIVHSQELIRALEAEISLIAGSPEFCDDLFDGVDRLQKLIRDIVFGAGSVDVQS